MTSLTLDRDPPTDTSATSARGRTALACAAAGLALAASIPPWGWWPAAFVGIAGVDRLIADQPAARRFRRTWLVAAVWLAIGMLWMWDLTPPGYVLAVITYAAYFGVAAVAAPAGPARLVALPAAFVLAEAARWAWPFGGVPLATLPQGQADGPLAEVVRVAGPLLLVAVVVVIGQGLASLLRRDLRAAALAATFVAAALAAAALAPTGSALGELSVAVVQGGGEQRTRDEPADRPVVFQRHLDASEQIEGPVDLIVWPENVVHVGDSFVGSAEAAALAAVARRHQASVVVGIIEREDGSRFRNAAVVIDPSGEVVDRYDKVRLVPFGEVTPFRSLLELVAGDTVVSRDAVAGRGPALLESPVGPLAVAISWEIFFAGRVREGLARGGEVVLNPTNAASYWLTLVQSQQIASSRLRALETDRWVVQAAPTGFSAVIRPDGTVVERSAVGERWVYQTTIERRDGTTLAVRLGDRVPIAAAALVILAVWSVAVKPRRFARSSVAEPNLG